jgi:cell division protein FtsA
MAEILQPRAEEIFSLLRDEVARAGFEKMLNAGVVLTGGGCLLPGTIEIAEQIFDMPVRIGEAGRAEGLVDPACGPQHAAAVGLTLYSAQHHKESRRAPLGMPIGHFGRVGDRVRTWFSEMF